MCPQIASPTVGSARCASNTTFLTMPFSFGGAYGLFDIPLLAGVQSVHGSRPWQATHYSQASCLRPDCPYRRSMAFVQSGSYSQQFDWTSPGFSSGDLRLAAANESHYG